MASFKDISKLVHLDLKGAPPKIAYYEKLFPLLRTLGATGLLVEYEDMFPYIGHLNELACAEAYSFDDIRQLQYLANLNGLFIVPLIQTFGHLEFVLKHNKFHHLREVNQFPNSICPSQEESKRVVFEMINQVLQMHPDIHWIHIGADEVWHLGQCSLCLQRCTNTGWTSHRLYLQHVVETARFIKTARPQVNVIIWDDMMRTIDIQGLLESGIQSLVEPMIWNYFSPKLSLPEGIWERFSTVFRSIWIASAFKGATGVHQMIPDINHHVKNHEAWLRALPSIQRLFRVKGWALTGWQRYDHCSVLCEILPTAIPSLALCLQTIQNGKFDAAVLESASHLLGSVKSIDILTHPRPKEIQQLQFPGSEIFHCIEIVTNLQVQHKALLLNNSFQGWFSEFHVKHRFCNPLHVQPLLAEATFLFDSFRQLKYELETSFSMIYSARTIEEWMMENIDVELLQMQSIVAKLQTMLTNN